MDTRERQGRQILGLGKYLVGPKWLSILDNLFKTCVSSAKLG